MPARILTIAQQKGGAGKTTIAAQLAVAYARSGRRVGLLDIDPQGSLAAWFEVRRALVGPDGGGIAFVQAAGWRLATELERLRRDLDLVLIDSPPHAETEVRLAVRAADLILVPVQPSPMDLWATGPTLEIARREKTPAVVVFNRTPAKSKLVEAVRRKIAETSVPVADSVLGNRVAFASAMMEGRGVLESHPRHVASREVTALADEIAGRLGLA
ncbi:ParA family partition ATPase [Magnetospirillum molischianum]|uniref:ATPase involved in chromosome partitioning n=1 Tax=Magnetospirillum molischianum DSM 120 TaxID=1150626 RepID=H8FNY5_MAGML|nr:ParA family partition ATPase [Magnetospirillum molischianum]CCG40073.1 ATPase involved in chromosome partitioning [Magnetospirillum molischianum DSM 120]